MSGEQCSLLIDLYSVKRHVVPGTWSFFSPLSGTTEVFYSLQTSSVYICWGSLHGAGWPSRKRRTAPEWFPALKSQVLDTWYMQLDGCCKNLQWSCCFYSVIHTQAATLLLAWPTLSGAPDLLALKPRSWTSATERLVILRQEVVKAGTGPGSSARRLLTGAWRKQPAWESSSVRFLLARTTWWCWCCSVTQQRGTSTCCLTWFWSSRRISPTSVYSRVNSRILLCCV